MENWKKINGAYKDGYFISDLGRVKVNGIIKIGSLRTDGYLITSIGKNGKYKLVHVLVMENFTNRPIWAECINHINGIKTDNRIENLEWSTLKLNNKHARDTGLASSYFGAYGSDHHLSRDISEVHKIYSLKKEGKRICEIARLLKRPISSVASVYNGVDWKYEYKKFFN